MISFRIPSFQFFLIFFVLVKMCFININSTWDFFRSDLMIDISKSLFDIFPISSCSCFCICFCFEFCGWFCFQNDFKLLVFVASRLSFRCYESTHFPKWGKVSSTNPCTFIRRSRFLSLLSLKLKITKCEFQSWFPFGRPVYWFDNNYNVSISFSV